MKQIIIIRKDLKMRRGKEIAQGAHASMAAIIDENKQISKDPRITKWLNGAFTKITVTVNSEEELLDIYTKAKEMFIPCAVIKDNGLTEFNGVTTYTAVAIGPEEPEVLNQLTGKLPLY